MGIERPVPSPPKATQPADFPKLNRNKAPSSPSCGRTQSFRPTVSLGWGPPRVSGSESWLDSEHPAGTTLLLVASAAGSQSLTPAKQPRRSLRTIRWLQMEAISRQCPSSRGSRDQTKPPPPPDKFSRHCIMMQTRVLANCHDYACVNLDVLLSVGVRRIRASWVPVTLRGGAAWSIRFVRDGPMPTTARSCDTRLAGGARSCGLPRARSMQRPSPPGRPPEFLAPERRDPQVPLRGHPGSHRHREGQLRGVRAGRLQAPSEPGGTPRCPPAASGGRKPRTPASQRARTCARVRDAYPHVYTRALWTIASPRLKRLKA